MPSLNIIVTGCSTGIGYSIAVHLASLGHTVFATMRRADTRKEGRTLRQIANDRNFNLYTISHDVDSEQSTSNCLGQCLHLSKNQIDVLINNAGVGGKVAPVEESEYNDFERIMKTNYLSPVRMIKMLLPHFRENHRGCIINVTSIAAQYWTANQASYCASKAALEAFSTSLSQEVRRFGIQVSTLQPGVVVTPILLKEQVKGVKGSPYSRHVRLSKKFYTAMMSTMRTRPIVVSKVVEQILHDFLEEKQRMHYVAGPDAIQLDKTLREKGMEWLAHDGGRPYVNNDQAHVDWFYKHFHLDVSASFKLKGPTNMISKM